MLHNLSKYVNIYLSLFDKQKLRSSECSTYNNAVDDGETQTQTQSQGKEI